MVGDQGRRAWIKGVVGAGVVAALGTGPISVLANSARLKSGVTSLDGRLFTDGKPAQVGDPVPPGALISTDSATQAVVVIGGHAYLVHGDTDARLPGSETADQVLTLISGRLLAVFDKGPKTLNTPFATIGIRGTGIYLDTRPERLYVCLCYGEADYRTQNGRLLESLTTEHHDAPRFICPPGAPKAIEAAPVFDHNDDQLKMLEWAVGRAAPFESKADSGGGGGGY